MKLKIISDGTNAGTHLVDTDTGEVIHKIQKLTWEVDAKNCITTTTVEISNIPVEIVSSADVALYEYKSPDYELSHSKDFQKEIKIVSDGISYNTEIYDNDTNEKVAAIRNIKWEATPYKLGSKVERIKFDNKDW
jgi:hypothetical protein